MKVLVAYASKYGATEGIAQRIGSELEKRGHDVVVARCADLGDVSGFDAYIVGSATYESHWRKAARKFVERNPGELGSHPLWLFSSGPVGTETVDENGEDVLKGAEPKQFAEYRDELGPRGTQVFRGAFDHEKVRGSDRIIAWLPGIRQLLPEGDYREWDVIDAWAQSVAEELQPAVAHG